MSYQSQREKIKKLIEDQVLKWIKEKDLDYYKIINFLQSETNCSQNMAEDMVCSFIKNKIIQENRILTIPDGEINEFVKRMKEREEEIEKEVDQVLG